MKKECPCSAHQGALNSAFRIGFFLWFLSSRISNSNDWCLRQQRFLSRRSWTYSPQGIGVAEQIYRKLLELTRVMLSRDLTFKAIWACAVVTASYNDKHLMCRCCISAVKSSYEFWCRWWPILCKGVFATRCYRWRLTSDATFGQ